MIPSGVLEPDATLDLLDCETDRAFRNTFSDLRVAGDMSRLLGKPPGCERIIEFDSRLSTFLCSKKCTVLCYCDRSYFGPAVLLHLLTSHPKIVMGSRVHRNRHYGAFPISWGAEPAGATLRRWLGTSSDLTPDKAFLSL